jgi:hypothetical protein
MLRNTVLATATAGAVAFIVYLIPTVQTALATGVQLKPGLVGVNDDASVILVKKGGGGKGGAAKRGGGGGGKHAKHGGGGKSHAKRRGGGDKSYARHDGGKSHAKRGGSDGHRYARHDGHDKGHAKRRGGGGKTIIVYRDGHRYWHGRQIWWWGPLVYSYDPCIRWVRFCPDCAREPINICYYEY